MSFDPLLPGAEQETEDPNAILEQAESGYLSPDVETDQDQITEAIFTALATRVPGWQAHDGNLDTWLIEAWAEIGAEIRSLAANVPASIFMTYGQNVLGIPPKIATPAAGAATFTVVDDQGYTIDIGTTFALARSGNDLVAFETLQEMTIEPGATSIDNVEFTAVETGADGNGLAGDGQMLDPLAWVAGVTVPAATVDGNDEETAADYLDRITLLLQMVALRPVLPQDFAILALQVEGVGRAVAMNLYDPATGTWNNARTVTLILTDIDGQPVSAGTKQTVADQLEALREVNWIVNVIDPTYDTVDVTFEVVAFAGQDQETVLQTCIANVTSSLQPGAYRLGELSPATAGGEVIFPPANGDITRRQAIHVNDIVANLDRSLGVDWVVTVEINGTAGDYQLPDLYALPTPGTITGTVQGANP